MRLPYKKLPLRPVPPARRSFVRRPVIPVHILHAGRGVACEALLDSGADFSIFHAEIADAMGLDLRKAEPVRFSGVSGSGCRGRRRNVTLELAGHRIRCAVVFADGLNLPYAILGQAEVFRRFVITFDGKEGWVDIRPRR